MYDLSTAADGIDGIMCIFQRVPMSSDLVKVESVRI
jgi:hypothetical protein